MLYHNLCISCTFHQKYVPTYAVGFTDSDEGQDSHEKQIVKIYDMWNDGIWWFLTIFECLHVRFVIMVHVTRNFTISTDLLCR